MSKDFKICLIVASSLLVFGALVFVITMSALKWDFKKLSTVKYETKEYEMTEDFKNILINTDTSRIVFLPSEDEKIKVVTYEQKKLHHEVSVFDNTLKIELNDTRKWYEHITLFSFGSPQITVYLPKKAYGALNIASHTGDIEIPKDFTFKSIDIGASTADINCLASATDLIKIHVSTGDIDVSGVFSKSIDLSASTGAIKLSGSIFTGDVKIKASTGNVSIRDVMCNAIFASGSTSNIKLTNAIVAEKIDITTSTGDIALDLSDGGEISLKASTGNITGTLLKNKEFDAKASTGHVSTPPSVMGAGKCVIRTSTGNIQISVVEK